MTKRRWWKYHRLASRLTFSQLDPPPAWLTDWALVAEALLLVGVILATDSLLLAVAAAILLFVTHRVIFSAQWDRVVELVHDRAMRQARRLSEDDRRALCAVLAARAMAPTDRAGNRYVAAWAVQELSTNRDGLLDALSAHVSSDCGFHREDPVELYELEKQLATDILTRRLWTRYCIEDDDHDVVDAARAAVAEADRLREEDADEIAVTLLAESDEPAETILEIARTLAAAQPA